MFEWDKQNGRVVLYSLSQHLFFSPGYPTPSSRRAANTSDKQKRARENGHNLRKYNKFAKVHIRTTESMDTIRGTTDIPTNTGCLPITQRKDQKSMDLENVCTQNTQQGQKRHKCEIRDEGCTGRCSLKNYMKQSKPVFQTLNGVLGCHRMPEELKILIPKSQI